MQLTQETLYFFTVLFVVHFGFWPHSNFKYLLGGIVMAISIFRYSHYVSAFLLQRAVSRLDSESKITLLAAHDRQDQERIASLLSATLHLNSADKVAKQICRCRSSTVQKLARLSKT